METGSQFEKPNIVVRLTEIRAKIQNAENFIEDLNFSLRLFSPTICRSTTSHGRTLLVADQPQQIGYRRIACVIAVLLHPLVGAIGPCGLSISPTTYNHPITAAGRGWDRSWPKRGADSTHLDQATGIIVFFDKNCTTHLLRLSLSAVWVKIFDFFHNRLANRQRHLRHSARLQ